MAATVRQIVTVQAGGVVHVQSDQLVAGAIAVVLITTDQRGRDNADNSSWATFVGTGANAARSVEEIDASIREMRDEWPL